MRTISIPAYPNNYGNWRPNSEVRAIVMHWTANKNDTAMNNGKYFSRPVHPVASAHAIADDDGVVISVPANYVAHSVGGALYNNIKQTGGGKMYGIVTNANSYNIEMCVKYSNGRHWISNATQLNAARHAAEIMKKYGIPLSRVYRHFDVTGKDCPRPMVDEKEWRKFKNLLRDVLEEEKVTDEKIIVDGEKITAKAIRKDGTVYVKIRDIADAVGYNISNDGKTPVLTKK